MHSKRNPIISKPKMWSKDNINSNAQAIPSKLQKVGEAIHTFLNTNDFFNLFVYSMSNYPFIRSECV